MHSVMRNDGDKQTEASNFNTISCIPFSCPTKPLKLNCIFTAPAYDYILG